MKKSSRVILSITEQLYGGLQISVLLTLIDLHIISSLCSYLQNERQYRNYSSQTKKFTFIPQNIAMRAITFVVFGMLLTYIVAEPGGGRKLLSVSLSLEQVACQPNGCSIPLNYFHYYKIPFRPACNKHDICYACVSVFITLVSRELLF